MDIRNRLLWAAPILLIFGSALADDHEPTDSAAPELPAPAASAAQQSAELPAQAAPGMNRAAEATIRLMDEADAELPGAVLNEIELPVLPGVARGDRGLEQAGEDRERRATGLEVAEGERENARENASEMAGEARENVEQRGRSEEFRPDDVPGPPDRP